MTDTGELPLSIGPDSMAITSVVPERRRRHSVEVIDVDLLDDEEIRTSQRPFQRRRLDSPELILLDSDEDGQVVASGSGIRQARRLRLFSPPAPPQDNAIPPVPVVPRHFSAHLSYPTRRRARQFPSTSSPEGIVRPNARPFSFETDIRASSSRRGVTHAISTPLEAVPPSHHTPAMGLGGALISRRAGEARTAHEGQDRNRERGRPQHQRPAGFVSHARGILTTAARRSPGIGIPNAFLPGGDYDGDDMSAIRLLIADAETDDATDVGLPDHSARAFTHRGLVLHHLGRGRGREDVDYKPSYTHPDSPDQGFTFDFTPPSLASSMSGSPPDCMTSSANPIVILDDDGDDSDSVVASSSRTGGSRSESSSSGLNMSTLLVCARCLDPLVLGGGMPVGGVEEERKRKLWGLLCGHLLDGKCLEEISRPSVPLHPLPVDIKGKGKAKVVEDAVDDHNDSLETNPDLNPIRSRLRPRTQRRLSTSNTASFSFPSPPAPPTLRSHVKRKGKTAVARASAKIEEKFEWVCPVTGCAREHVSVKVGGVWGMNRDSGLGRGRGAIGLFV